MASGATERATGASDTIELPSSEFTSGLVALAQAGDQEALAELVESYRPLMVKASRVGLRPPHLATVDEADLLQEAAKAFIELVQEYRPERGAIGPYLKRKLKWRVANYLRAERRRAGLQMADHSSTLARSGKLPNSGPAVRVSGVRLQALLRRLTPRQRAVIYKRHWEEKRTAEMAAEMGISPQAVTALERRAERALKERLLDDSLKPNDGSGRSR